MIGMDKHHDFLPHNQYVINVTVFAIHTADHSHVIRVITAGSATSTIRAMAIVIRW